MDDVLQKTWLRVKTGAERYIEDEGKSDPFLATRVWAQLRRGPAHWLNQHGQLLYDATAATVTVHLDPGLAFSDGSTSYQKTVWRDISRG